MTSIDSDTKEPQNKKDAVKLWHERVSLAKQGSDEWFRTSGSDRITEEYNGKFKILSNLKGRIPVPPINTIWAYVQTDVANTYNRDPYISVNPKAGTVLGAKLWETIINYYWKRLKVKEEVEPEIIDKDLCGFAWHKVGYQVETEGSGEELKLKHESLYSARVDPKDVVWNFGAKDPPNDCLWMAQRITKPLNYIKEKYPKAKGLKGVPSSDIDKNLFEKSIFKDDISFAVLWEIWDGQKKEIIVIAEGMTDDYLEPPRPWPDYISEYPFIYYFDFYAPGEKRPKSAILPWEPQVHEEMVMMAAAVNHHKRWNRQAIVKNGFLDAGELDKMERGDDCGYLLANGTGSVQDNVLQLDWGSMPVDYYMLIDRLKSIRGDVSGQSEFMRGGVTKTTTRTEGELQLIAQGAKGRVDRRIDRFETHLENIARQMLAHLKANFDFEETVFITGMAPEGLVEILGNHYDPITKAVRFTPNEIEGEYDVEIKSGSTIPLNRENKVQLLQNVMRTLGAVSSGPTGPFLRVVIKELLDEYDMKSLEVAESEEIQMQDKMAAQAAQSGNANEIKARSQGAKNAMQAKKISADTDKIDLENMITEQIVGVPDQGAEDQTMNGGMNENVM